MERVLRHRRTQKNRPQKNTEKTATEEHRGTQQKKQPQKEQRQTRQKKRWMHTGKPRWGCERECRAVFFRVRLWPVFCRGAVFCCGPFRRPQYQRRVSRPARKADTPHERQACYRVNCRRTARHAFVAVKRLELTGPHLLRLSRQLYRPGFDC